MIALYPGAFKPPHRGHFEVVQGLLKGNHGGQIYTKDTGPEAGAKALAGEPDKVEKIDKVVIFLGGGERNGITKGESKAIWEIYSKYLGNVEIVDGQVNPMMEAKEYAKAHPDEQFYAVTGVRGEEDFIDLRRITTFGSRDNVQGLAVPSVPGAGVRATDLRKVVLNGSLDDIRDFFPKELNRQELLTILKMLKDNIISEMLEQRLEDIFNQMFITEEVKEGSSGTPIAPKSAVRSEDRQKLEYLYTYIKNVVPSNAYVSFQQDRITVSLQPTNPYDDKVVYEGVDTNKLTEYIGSILEYMIDQGMKVTPLPEVKIKRDAENAANFFGKTAHYDPTQKEVVLYVEGRHMKDVCRSFVHEMIHHIQNLEGRLGNIQTSNTNEDDHLLEIEKEAYLQGNITFRNWEDSIKNANEDVDGKKAFSREVQLAEEVMSEGKYDKLTNQVSSDIFNYWKQQIDSGEDGAQFKKTYDALGAKFDVEGLLDLTFDNGTMELLDTSGAGTDEKGDFIIIEIEIDEDLLPSFWEEISMTLKDVVRHEIEHLTHNRGGITSNPRKALQGDLARRDKIKSGQLPRSSYFKLKKEVDANLQGMLLRAKKEKRPMKDVVSTYLDAQDLTEKERKDILTLWRKRLPFLGIRQEI